MQISWYWFDECFIFERIDSVNAFIKAWFIHISSLKGFLWLGYPFESGIKDDLNFKNQQIKQADGWT